ncbi:MAG: hypothetical protein WDA60_13845 [Acidimicrobiia bacterium]
MRLLDDATLAELGRDPVERVRDAVERGDAAAAADLAARARRGWARGIDGFRAWIVHTLAFLTDRFGATEAGLALGEVIAAVATWTPWSSAEPTPETTGIALLDALRADARVARDEHDRWLDAVCVALTHVYRIHGVDVLRDAIEYAGDQTLLAWMPDDIGRDPVARVRTWTAMLQGNFASVSVSEDDAKFTVTQDPCGSCGRQLAAGRHPGPLDLATVREVHPITFERGDVPVYRTHVAVMHFLVPEARIGVPWPVVACPRGLDAAPCRIHLYKDPLDPAAHADAAALRATPH